MPFNAVAHEELHVLAEDNVGNVMVTTAWDEMVRLALGS
jgi:hypothetical protein